MIRIANLSGSPKYFQWKFVGDSFDFASWIKEEEWAHDADNGGDSRKFWVVTDGTKVTYYEVKHSWWIEYDPEWQLYNEFEIAEIPRSGVEENKYARENLRFVI